MARELNMGLVLLKAYFKEIRKSANAAIDTASLGTRSVLSNINESLKNIDLDVGSIKKIIFEIGKELSGSMDGPAKIGIEMFLKSLSRESKIKLFGNIENDDREKLIALSEEMKCFVEYYCDQAKKRANISWPKIVTYADLLKLLEKQGIKLSESHNIPPEALVIGISQPDARSVRFYRANEDYSLDVPLASIKK